MKNKKWLIFGSGVLILVLFTANYAVSGFRNQLDRHFDAATVREHLIAKVDYAMQEIALTTDQQGQYAAIRARMGASIEAAVDNFKRIHDELAAKWDKDEPDVKALAADLKTEINAMPRPVVTQIDYLVEIYDILNPDQQKKLVAMIKERHRKHGRHPEPKTEN